MTMRQATREEIAQWNDVLHRAPGGFSYLQDLPFGEVKRPDWTPRPMIHEVEGCVIPVLYLVRHIPLLGEYWYAPSGPRVANESQFQAICADLRVHARTAVNVVCEPSIRVADEAECEALMSRLNAQAVTRIQGSTHTVIVNLTRSEEELLASFRQRTRRYIRKAKDAVVEHIEDESAFEPFLELLQAMSLRAHVAMREKRYYFDFWRRYLDLGKGHFVLMRPAEGEPYAAGAFLICDGDDAYYKDGGSIRSKDANGLQYVVQWESMKWCKERGAQRYDMLGVPPSWKADDPSDHLHGLVQFKTGFGPIVDEVGALSIHRSPVKDYLWERVGRRFFNLRARKTKAQFY